ncbi:MAG: RNA polymerase sigma-54 factor, partial [Planctomycetia bacterium]
MRMSFGQEMRMAQKQMLAPRMIQSMEILQLPLQALEERIEQEIQNNETLEVDEAEGEAGGGEQGTAVAEPPAVAERTVDEKPLVVDQEHANQADFERSYDWANEYPDSDDDRSRPSAARIDEASDRYLDAMANMEERPETLFNHLHDQLSNYDLSAPERQAADKIIYNLDANGYLTAPLEDLVDPEGPPDRVTQLALLEKALGVVQGMDPLGVAARDLRECLLLQIRSDMPRSRQLRRLVSDHLEDLAGNRLPLIERKTGYSITEIEQLREQLHAFNPKPGAVFSVPFVPAVKPDVYVEQQADGSWKVRLEDVDLPNLRISPVYRQMLLSPDTDAATREYIKRKINSAQWLIESIEQRRSTLLKTAQAIVDHQTRFLTEGPEAIEPLKMQQIAD